ncbi:DNA-binding response regulator [Humibacillus sp. DSM 29435]|uniref:response regulator n=1 Tax=Humibacillus sp. DSM 29435 TaxID=1869167 RepID=UPI0008731339|nr:response regulator transcription factor [Humibacillus sp. DSM 29435]OFE17229.1 DNA-binding response regulator [Humibacillus sp. DSM 29435]
MTRPPTSPHAAEPVRVVIVDDHPVVRDGLRGMLEREPSIEVVGEAAGGHEALPVIAAAAPDVVLMDLRMPAGDGIGAIRALRALPARRGDRPRILVLTTYDTDRDIRAAMDAGANGYLLKDIPRAELVRAVHDLAEGRPVLTASALEALTGRREQTSLTARELEVLQVIASGGTNRSAAERLLVSEATVKTHLLHVYEKLGVSDRAAAVRVAYERRLL